ncbi:hypothetical protein [Kitasatospora kifunensis]|uniref:Uncharacterized protein n=1 Tax=Kitasatospora kifunensis TaxID=58351 RepID=A0A7W7QYQ7_KITKI|nr:hypothetical protein [Kitasatospora kifunensis]MBB4922164.1 hypothetical protein [Kitasatospora kifunensis]
MSTQNTTTVSIPQHVADEFVDAFTIEIATDLAQQLSCHEVGKLADLLTALGAPDVAAVWIEEHSLGDDNSDSHHLGN